MIRSFSPAYARLSQTANGPSISGYAGVGEFNPVFQSAKSIMWIGDSITQYGGGYRHPQQNQNMAHYRLTSFAALNAGGNWIRYATVHPQCPKGNGTMRYYHATREMSWQANGDTEGARVSVAAGGFVTLESGTANHTMYVAMVNRFYPTSDTSDTINVTGMPEIIRCDLSGFSGWTELLLGCPFDVTLNYGISGATSSELLAIRAQWDEIITDITVISLGTNQSSTMAAAIISVAAIREIAIARKNAGSRVIVGTLWPNDGETAESYGAKLYHIHATIEMARELGIECFDSYSWLAGANATDMGYRDADCTNDGLHPSSKGAYIVARRALVPILQKYVNPVVPRHHAGIAYNAITAPQGNLVTNGIWAGLDATPGTRVTGETGAGWTSNMSGGSVCSAVATAPESASPIARTDGYPGYWQRYVISNTGGVDGEYLSIYQSAYISASNYVAGDYIELSGELRLSGVGIASVRAFAGGSLGKTYAIYSNFIILDDLDGDTISVYYRSLPLRIEAGVTNLQVNIYIELKSGGSATLDLGDVVLKKVNG